jgi:hypothetical protein
VNVPSEPQPSLSLQLNYGCRSTFVVTLPLDKRDSAAQTQLIQRVIEEILSGWPHTALEQPSKEKPECPSRAA